MILLANMLASMQKLYGQSHSFQILSIFSYDILLVDWQADMACQFINYIFASIHL